MTDLTADDVRRMAEGIGLKALGDEHLQQLARATQAALKRRSALRSETLEPSDEPAHVLRLGAEGVR